MKFRYGVPMDDTLDSNSKNPVQNKVIKEYVDNSVKNIAASNITSGTLSSDRLSIVPVIKGGTGSGFKWLESADLQEKPRVILLKEDDTNGRYFDAYSALPLANGGLGNGNIVDAPDNSLLVKQTDGNGTSFVDYTRSPEVESIQIGGCTLNYDNTNKFLEFVFTTTSDSGTEV